MRERSLLGFGGVSQAGDQADGRLVTSPEDDASAHAVGAVGAEEGNVRGLEHVLVLLVFLTKQLLGLTSQRGVIHLHFIAREEDEISRDLVTTLHLDDIARHERSGLNLLLLPITDDLADLRDEVLEVVHERGGLGRLRV